MMTMNGKLRFLAAAALCLSSLLLTTPASAAEDEAAVQGRAQGCLTCHGSFEDLQKKTENWKDEWGDPVNPHVYIERSAAHPHQAGKVLPDCTKCHAAHSMPIKDEERGKEVDVSYCYGCHHMETFEPCGKSGCHEGRAK